VHRNRSIGKFHLDLEAGGGDRSKVVVRFDLTLDGTLSVTVTQPATGIRKELTIENALSQFQADQRDRAEARLGAMFDTSDELLEDNDLPSLQKWSDSGQQDAKVAEETANADANFPAAQALLSEADRLMPSVGKEDAEDIQALTRQLKQAIASEDQAKVNRLCEELDDVLFYVK
jgi:molecular chaperone DnaK (HSP70)